MCVCTRHSVATFSSTSFFFQSLCVRCCVAGLCLSGSHLLPLLSLIWMSTTNREHPPPPPPGGRGKIVAVGFLSLVWFLGTPDFSLSKIKWEDILEFNNKLQNYDKIDPQTKNNPEPMKGQEIPFVWIKTAKVLSKSSFGEGSFSYERFESGFKNQVQWPLFMEMCAHHAYSDRRDGSVVRVSADSAGPVLPTDCSISYFLLQHHSTVPLPQLQMQRGQMSRSPVFRMWFIVNSLLKAVGLWSISLRI